jgi:S-(hydroxymethyl)glutathione dehydrogenase / alcohol dehydrogenase
MPRAAVLYDIDTPLKIVELDIEPPRADEIEVAIAATGICHSDLSAQRGIVDIPRPVVLGHEGAGTVTRTGANVTNVSPGDRVVLSWVASCGTCYWCSRGEVHLCQTGQAAADAGRQLDGTLRFHVDGSGVHQMSALGTFAERIVVPARTAVPIPDHLPLELAALIGCGVLTGIGAATRTASIRTGDTVLVIGCGGVGLNTIQGAALVGATTIVAVDLSKEKLDLAKQFGATHVVDGRTDDPVDVVRALTGGRGADVAFEVIGLEATIAQAVRATRRGGETILVGIPDRNTRISTKALPLVYGAKTIRGSWYGSSHPVEDVRRLIELHDAGRIQLKPLIGRTLSLDEINDGIADLEGGSVARSVIQF